MALTSYNFKLYGHGLLSKYLMQRWLHRLLFETVYPSLPSLWELEAACVLLIVILPRLHRLAAEAETERRKEGTVSAADVGATKMERSPAQSAVAPTTPKKQTRVTAADAAADPANYIATEHSASSELRPVPAPATPQRRDAPADHWIHLTPAKARRYSMSLLPPLTATAEAGPGQAAAFGEKSTSAANSEVDLLAPDLSAAEVVQCCTTRLRQLRTVVDIHHESKEWIEVSLPRSCPKVLPDSTSRL